MLLLTDDPVAAERIGAGMVESAVYEIGIPANRLVNLQGAENRLTPAEG